MVRIGAQWFAFSPVNHLARTREPFSPRPRLALNLLPTKARPSRRKIVKLFRLLALMLAIGVFPSFSILAQAQQEVDPDHYEPMQVSQVSRSGANAHANHRTAYTGHWHSHTRMASKHSGRANHHRARVSA